jgi:hypothetical protein
MAGLSCNQMITEYTHGYYSVHRNLHYIIAVDLIRTLMCFDSCCSVSVRPRALMNAGHPWTVWTPANEVTIIAAVE